MLGFLRGGAHSASLSPGCSIHPASRYKQRKPKGIQGAPARASRIGYRVASDLLSSSTVTMVTASFIAGPSSKPLMTWRFMKT